MSQNVIITCALTGILTNPEQYPVPVTPEQMAAAAQEAYDAGATVVHCHFRQQEAGKGAFPTWEPNIVAEICDAIRSRVPELLINMSTGVVGADLEGPLACLERVRPEIAALNSGSLNYLKVRRDGSWAWPPMLFDNPVSKIQQMLDAMKAYEIVPECECFDTGIVRSILMFQKHGMLPEKAHVSLVMGVASGMPAKAAWLPLLLEELSEDTSWQVIAIGREEVWPLLEACIALGGDARTGLEDTFYLPDGSRATSNGALVEALAQKVRESGREIASPEEARSRYGLRPKA